MSEHDRTDVARRAFEQRAAHDLQAPISTARGLVGIAEEDAADGIWDDVPMLLRDVRVQLERLDALVNGIADHARAAHAPEPSQSLHLERLLGEMVEDVFGRLGPDAIRPTVDLEIGVERLDADPGALRRVIHPMIANACHHADPNQPDPRIRVRAYAEGDTLCIEVEDNGPGLEETDLAQLCEPFYRGTAAVRGPGLGLAIVARQLRRLGGTLELDSAAAPTRFRVLIPFSGTLARAA